MILVAFPLPLRAGQVDPERDTARLTRWAHRHPAHPGFGWLRRLGRLLRHGSDYACTTAAVNRPQEG